MCKLHIIQGLGFLNLKDTLIVSTILRTSKKTVWSNDFCYIKECISEIVFNTLFIEINHIC